MLFCNNYLGFYGKSGVEIRDEFANHLKAMDIEIIEEKVNSIIEKENIDYRKKSANMSLQIMNLLIDFLLELELYQIHTF